MKQGDLVVRKSYGKDMIFRVVGIVGHRALLRGTDYRLLADAPLSDLEQVCDPDEIGEAKKAKTYANESIRRMQEQSFRQVERAGILAGLPDRPSFFEWPGKVLHLDGDGNYLRKSLQVYGRLRVSAEGLHCHESQMPHLLMQLLPQIRPDIVVITGHDGVLKQQRDSQHLGSYKNSLNFVNAVRVAREYERHKDGLIVVAGACQSHFEALMEAGANFASSPARIMIHALDPVYIAIRSAYTPFRETIHVTDVISGTIGGMRGFGGIETAGTYRMGVPNKNGQAKNVNIV